VPVPAVMQRDQRIDTIRGLLLVIMTIDHFGGRLALYTSETLGYVSALEGFLFLSAFVFASVYLRYAQQPRQLMIKSLSRAALIYRYHAILLLCVPVLVALAPVYRQSLWNWVLPYFRDPTYYGIKSLLLLHQPVYMDILPVYFFLVLLSPLVLLACVRGWGRGGLLLSLLFWLASHYFNPIRFLAGNVCDHCRYGFLNLLAWQLLWVSGLVLGFRRYSGRAIAPPRHPLLIALLIVIAGLLFLLRHGWLEAPLSLAGPTSRENLGWLRLVDFFVVLVLVSALLSRIPSHRGLGWLSFIGRYSIQVFSFHVFLAYVTLPLRPAILHASGPLGYTLFTLLMVASLTLPAWLYQRYRQSRQRIAA